jgi:hypothetical protein
MTMYYESLGYAQQNRVEWERKGHEIVAQLLLRCQKKYVQHGGLIRIVAALPETAVMNYSARSEGGKSSQPISAMQSEFNDHT